LVDAGRSAVSLTYTLEQSYGSKLGVPELGFLFNNEMGDFNPRPGYTNRKGLIGSSPNTIAPEKRMLSSMTPTIVVRNGSIHLVIGSPGGRTIINTVFQTLIASMEYGLRVDRAIEAPKIHHGWLPDEVRYERDKLSPDTRILLEKWGHTLVPRNSLGALNGIQLIPQENILLGASDSANPDGAAVGY
jgi:gamma-glutamyltranspeptidase/glutathione hydrolase